MDKSINDFSSLSTRGYFAFISELSGIVEIGDWIVGALFNLKPFASVEEYYEKLCQFMDQLPTLVQVGIIRCQAQLLTMSTATMSKSSFKEQTMRFHNIDTSKEVTIQELKKQYFDKFEFPFVCCVRENSIESILEQLQSRIGNNYQKEINNNIKQIKRIAWYRLVDKFKIRAKL